MNNLTPEQKEMLIEQYIILLLGVDKRPIPTNLHLQKEFFVLRNVAPKLEKLIKFEKHMYGPYSPDINEALKNPMYYHNAFSFYYEELPLVGKMITRITLTREGKRVYKQILREYGSDIYFQEFLAIAKAVRMLYDSLSYMELLLLIYTTFKDWTEYSKIYYNLMESVCKNEIVNQLFKKGFISKKKYHEMLEAKP